jgi:pSer/pThr/pTyr-binding forkhead associated (FHA) protein
MTNQLPEHPDSNPRKDIIVHPQEGADAAQPAAKAEAAPAAATAALVDPLPKRVPRTDTVMLLLPGNDKPLVFKNPEPILLGRRDESISFAPTVDLTRYYGVMMGVSRRHAEITMTDGRVFAQDLGSANGTWLNERRLEANQNYEMHNGDQLRLGQLLILVFLASSESAVRPPGIETRKIDKMVLRRGPHVSIARLTDRETTNGPRSGVSPDYVATTFGDFLRALGLLQRIIRTAQGHTSELMVMRSMRCDGDALVVELTQVDDLLDFLYERLPEIVKETGALGMSDAQFYREAASRLLDQVVFRSLDDQRDAFITRLVEPLSTLFESPIDIASIVEHRPL